MLFFNKNKFLIDIGSNNISGMHLKFVKNKWEIIAQESVQSLGIDAGRIIDIHKFSKQIKTLQNNLEKKSKTLLDKVSLILSGPSIKSQKIKIALTVDKKVDEITQKNLMNKLKQWSLSKNLTIINYTPINYTLDYKEIVLNPDLMHCSILEAFYMITAIDKNQFLNLINVMHNLDLVVEKCLPASFVASFKHLNEDEKNLGSGIIDIGSDSIDVCIFKNNAPIFMHNFEFGSNIFTKQIAKNFSLKLEEAESIKKKYGSLILSSEHFCEWVEINPYNENSKSVLRADIIRSLMPEIEKMINILTPILSIDNIHTIVLCGGGSWINDMPELLSKKSRTSIRLSSSEAPCMDALLGYVFYFNFNIKINSKIQKIFSLGYWLKQNF